MQDRRDFLRSALSQTAVHHHARDGRRAGCHPNVASRIIGLRASRGYARRAGPVNDSTPARESARRCAARKSFGDVIRVPWCTAVNLEPDRTLDRPGPPTPTQGGCPAHFRPISAAVRSEQLGYRESRLEA